MPLALVSRRLVAFAADVALSMAALLVAQLALLPWNPLLAEVRRGGTPSPVAIHLWVFATVSVPVWIYFTSSFSSKRSATLGMRLLDLRVAGLDGGGIGRGAAALRAALLLLPWEASHAVLFHLGPRGGEPEPPFYAGLAVVWGLVGLYLATCRITPRSQGPHDLAASTVVLSGPNTP